MDKGAGLGGGRGRDGGVLLSLMREEDGEEDVDEDEDGRLLTKRNLLWDFGLTGGGVAAAVKS